MIIGVTLVEVELSSIITPFFMNVSILVELTIFIITVIFLSALTIKCNLTQEISEHLVMIIKDKFKFSKVVIISCITFKFYDQEYTKPVTINFN